MRQMTQANRERGATPLILIGSILAMSMQNERGGNMSGSILLITGWILVVAATAMLLTYRLLLRHYDRQLLRLAPDIPNPLHAVLQNRITAIDRWGVPLTIGIVLYTVLFLVYLLYQSFERVAQTLLHLLSYI